MQCYETLAATTLIAKIFETLPEIGRKMPPAAISEWMAQHDIEPEDVLHSEPGTARAMLVSLIEKNQPRIPRAA